MKRVKLKGRLSFEFRGEMLNAFNHPNFTPVIPNFTPNNLNANNADNYRVTELQENSSRIVQLVWRASW